MQARLEAPADPQVRLLRVYSGGLKWASSPEGLQEFLDGNEEYYRVWSHPEPLPYTVENVAAYIRAAFALTDGGRERLGVVPAAEGNPVRWPLWRVMSGRRFMGVLALRSLGCGSRRLIGSSGTRMASTLARKACGWACLG